MEMLSKLQKYREEEAMLQWEGTFSEYLQMIKRRPEIAESAHARLYNMIKHAGIKDKDGRKRYEFFSDEIFGLEETLEKLVEEYFHPAAKKLDVKKRILLLMGPVGGGKSTIVTLLKRGLEQFTRTDEGAVYAIKDCPMHEDPLHLITNHLRDDFYNQYGMRIEGSLAPLNTLRLEQEYD